MKLAVICGQKSEGIKNKLLSIHDNLQIDAYMDIDSMIKNSIQRQYFYDRILFASHLVRGAEVDNFYKLKDYIDNDSRKTELIYLCNARDTDSARDFDEIFTTPNFSSYLTEKVTLETLKNASIMKVDDIFRKYSYLKERPAQSEVEYYDIDEEQPKMQEEEPVEEEPAKGKKKKGLFGGMFKGKKGQPQSPQGRDDLASQEEYTDNTDWEDEYYNQGYEDDGYYGDENGNYDTNYDESSQIAESWDDGVYSENSGDYDDYPETGEEINPSPNASTAVDYDDTYENYEDSENYENSKFSEQGEDDVYGGDAPYDTSDEEVYGEDAPYDTDEEPYDEDEQGYVDEGQNYTDECQDYVDEGQGYANDQYPEDAQGYSDNYDDDQYPEDQGYGEPNYSDGYADEQYPEQGYEDDQYADEQGYDDAQYNNQGYSDGYEDDQYPEQGYEDDQYANQDYDSQGYADDQGYEDEHGYYNNQGYEDEEQDYSKDSYPEDSYPEDSYPEDEPDTTNPNVVDDEDDDWSIKEEPSQTKGTPNRGFRNAPRQQEPQRPDSSVEDDDFSSFSVDKDVIDDYKKDTTNVVVKEKIVVKHIPIDGAKGGLFAGLVNGTSKRTFIVTGDRGTGVTSLAWEMAKFLSQSIPVLYFDCDVRTHGLLSYVEYKEIAKFGNAQLQGTKFCKSVNQFYNCVIPYADNLDIITSDYGTRTTKEELAVTAQIIGEKSLDYGAVIVDVPFDTLSVIEDLMVSSTVLFCVTATKVGFMNAVCVLEDNDISDRYLRQMFTKGKMVFTKKNKYLKIDALKKYVNDIVELEKINWLEMNAVVLGERVDSNFVAALLD